MKKIKLAWKELTAPHGCGSRRLVWPKASFRLRPNMNDNILYHARLVLRSPRPAPPFRPGATTRRPRRRGEAKKSRTMMSREWVKDTREAWERAANEALRRAGCGERIDHRSLAERRDEAERAGDLEQAAELSEKRGIPPRAAHPPDPPTRTPPQVPSLSDSASSGIPLWTMRTGLSLLSIKV